MALDTFTHAYVTAQGEWSSGTRFAGEIAQVGFRVAVWNGGTNIEVDDLLPVGPLETVYQTGEDTNYRWSVAWQGASSSGLPGGERAFGADEQLELADLLVQNCLSAWAPSMAAGFLWKTIKVAPIHSSGKYATGASVFELKNDVGGGASQVAPPELAVAVTMRTPILGRRGRGRVFVPAIGRDQIANTGTVLDVASTRFATGVGDFIGLVKSQMGSDYLYRVVVTSAASDKYVLPQTVSVGDLFDVQRRRQAQVDEVYNDAINVG